MYEWIGKITADAGRLDVIGRWAACLPRPVALAACQMLGRALYDRAGSVRERVKANMGELLGELQGHPRGESWGESQGESGESRLEACCREYFLHGALGLYEVLVAFSDPKQRLDRFFTIEGEEYLETALASGRGAILFTPHLGNFFYYYWLLSRRYPCLTVGTTDSPEIRPVYERFHRMGCRGLDYDATSPSELVRKLRLHLEENGLVFLHGDFWRPHFPQAHFFGRPTRSPGGTALLALEMGVPVVPFYGRRIRGFEHRLVFCPPIYLHKEFRPHERTEATNRLNRLLAEMIAWVPEQWFYWFNVHERWEKRAMTGAATEGAMSLKREKTMSVHRENAANGGSETALRAGFSQG
ncbi:lipid A biosynthesis acyltransferase [Heliobacterium undosum]|uniref:Lipid A biosynthesis acyltransferase n=1 Tax=Heliomicrobium undosum TaxID=121734 RepID=A0A845L4U7_9FIRM|nr:lysophospholipid acyltransferase family protein [Heliomicrobium undosum]MZP30726.1 lipid A biosynthesis acyltransferase [Heliomicrobium undosum]